SLKKPASSRPSTDTSGGRPDVPSAARWPSSVSPRIRRSDMRRSVSGFANASRIQRRNGGTFSSWSPLAGESPASWEAGGNNGNRNDSCQAPFGVGDLAVPVIPRYAVGVIAQRHRRVHKNPTPLCGREIFTGQCRPNRICISRKHFHQHDGIQTEFVLTYTVIVLTHSLHAANHLIRCSEKPGGTRR